MCQASKVAEDWVNKGCHVHIGAVEIAVFPNHKGGVGFEPVFSARNEAVVKALKTVEEECLPNHDVRAFWTRSLRQAMIYMLSVEGELSKRANGRMLEFKFLIIALDRYRE
jgi:hypothetical protein